MPKFWAMILPLDMARVESSPAGTVTAPAGGTDSGLVSRDESGPELHSWVPGGGPVSTFERPPRVEPQDYSLPAARTR